MVTFDKVANKKTSPGELAALPQTTWDNWLTEGMDYCGAIISGLKQILPPGL
jgi:hypothetical protein